MTKADKDKILDRMMTLCSRRECCRRDVAVRLSRLEAPERMAEEIIATLCREKYIDEQRYASAFARDKSSLQGWGPRKISLALAAKGIERDTIAAAIGDIDAESSEAKLKTLITNKLRQLRDTDRQTARRKILRFAMGRGYSYDQIINTYDNIRTD